MSLKLPFQRPVQYKRSVLVPRTPATRCEARADLVESIPRCHYRSSSRTSMTSFWWCEIRRAGPTSCCASTRRESRDAAEMQPRCSRDAAEVQPRCSRGAAEVCRLDIPLRADEAARTGPRTLNAMCGSCLSQTWSREGRPSPCPRPPLLCVGKWTSPSVASGEPQPILARRRGQRRRRERRGARRLVEQLCWRPLLRAAAASPCPAGRLGRGGGASLLSPARVSGQWARASRSRPFFCPRPLATP